MAMLEQNKHHIWKAYGRGPAKNEIRSDPSLAVFSQNRSGLITKTYLYNFDPLKPHFYISKTGVYRGIQYFISAQKHRLWVLVRTASSLAVLTSTHSLCFEQKYEKYQNFLSENFHFLVVKFSEYLNRHVFVMYPKSKADAQCDLPDPYPTFVVRKGSKVKFLLKLISSILCIMLCIHLVDVNGNFDGG